MRKALYGSLALIILLGFTAMVAAYAWTAIPVKEDPLVRMPGTQPAPENSPDVEASTRCLNCHGGYNPAVEPAFNWKGSMMAQAARDFLFWACLTVAAQDSIWAIGRPNATDICLRCHMPDGWLAGRSDPTNGSAMKGSDFDGVSCDMCHSMFDPFFEATFNGSRESSDWLGYWDETNKSSTPSNRAAEATLSEDRRLASGIKLFNGSAFYSGNFPPASYTENGAGQYFVDDNRGKRASFADASARHPMYYSRYHKSKYFCSTCHDVSNPVLANLLLGRVSPSETKSSFTGTGRKLWTEIYPAFSYFHVERTFSEFILSAYGQADGAPGIGPFAPSVFNTSKPNNYIAACQDCHMRDVTGKACSQNDGVLRPTNSVEHPKSGLPLHDLTGGNMWVSYVLASAVSGSPNYDPINAALLNQGPGVLTLDLTAGTGIDPVALLAGVDRAKQQLKMAASIENVSYSPSTGSLSFRIQNQTGHKLISGFPEGRRMFVNIKAYKAGNLIFEINPYDYAVGTLKGLGVGSSPALGPNERYVDELVYEAQMSSTLTGESKTFHFALATGRYKDNRIPPKGFRISEAEARHSEPWYGGVKRLDYFTPEEYEGGYDDVSVSIPPGADYIEVTLYYQTTSREYVEFLRDEINGTANTLRSPTPAGNPQAYIVQSDPWFAKLKAWGNTIWELWDRNKNVEGAKPVIMTQATWGTPTMECTIPGVPQNLKATGGQKKITLSWSAGTPAPTGGYRIYYDQAGKKLFRASVPAGTTTYTDTGLSGKTTYCYSVTAWNDCNGNGTFDPGIDSESAHSNVACATTR
jgi:cytochrome c553